MSPIDIKYQTLGGPTSFLGNPIQNEAIAPDGEGVYRHYERGSIHWHPDTGAFSTNGGIRWLWSELKWELSFLGYPISDEQDITSSELHKKYESTIGIKLTGNIIEPFARISIFQFGAIVWLKENRLIAINKHGDLVFPQIRNKRNIYKPALWLDINSGQRNKLTIREHGGFEVITREQSSGPYSTYGLGTPDEVKEIRTNIEEELFDYLLYPILSESDQNKSAYLFENNYSEYRDLRKRRTELLKIMFEKQSKVATPKSMDIELLVLNANLREFEKWFLTNGYDLPEEEPNEDVKKVWKKGKKAAATYCIAKQSKRPNMSKIEVCREFLKEWTIESEPEYTPEMLSNFVAKLRSEENWGKREIQ